jgi:hypothetical protein
MLADQASPTESRFRALGVNPGASSGVDPAKEARMPYELRMQGQAHQQFETEQEAVDAAKMLLQQNPETDPEIIDLSTGHAAAPGATRNWREELRSRVGF